MILQFNAKSELLQWIAFTISGLLLFCACRQKMNDSIAFNKSATEIVEKLLMLSFPSAQDDPYSAADKLVRPFVQSESDSPVLVEVYRICEIRLASQSLSPTQRIILHQTQVVILFHLANPETKDGCMLLTALKNDSSLEFDGEMGLNLRTALEECTKRHD